MSENTADEKVEAAWAACEIECGELADVDLDFDGTAYFTAYADRAPTKGWLAVFNEVAQQRGAEGKGELHHFSVMAAMHVFKMSRLRTDTASILGAHTHLQSLIHEANAKYARRRIERGRLRSNLDSWRASTR